MSEIEQEFFKNAHTTLSADFSAAQVKFALDCCRGLNISFSAKARRRTKLGDFRQQSKGGPIEISYTRPQNEAERQQSYLTLLHEIAHALTYQNFNRRRIKPHGPEWQQCFGELIKLAVAKELFAPQLEVHLLRHAEKPAARAGVDNDLEQAFNMLRGDSALLCVEDVQEGLWFKIDGEKWFKKGPKLRKNFRGTSPSGADFRIPPSMEVLELREQKPEFTQSPAQSNSVAELKLGQSFQLNGPLVFTKGPRLRKYFRCTANNGKTYRIHPDAPVSKLIDDE